MDKTEKIRVAAIQASPVLLDIDATTEKACRLIARASDEKARLAVFPECFLPGYPVWLDFYKGTHPQALACYKRLFSASVELGGPQIARLREAARATNMILVVGICERRPGTTGTLYNSQVFIDNHGTLLGVHRKLVPTLKERFVHTPGYGQMMRAYQTELGTIGGLICGENSNPLAKFALMAQGEMIHAAAWPAYFSAKRMNDTINFVSRSLAYESKTFVISAAAVLDEEAIATLGLDVWTLPTKDIFSTAGGSCIVGPDAEVLAGPLLATEDIVTCEIDPGDILVEKMFHDFSGHYNRADVFSLRVKNPGPDILEMEGANTVVDEAAPEE